MSDSILEKITEIFVDVLDEDVELTYESTADDVEEWDSLAHIQLVVAIERKFGIKFSTLEIQNWKNVGDMCKLIDNKTT